MRIKKDRIRSLVNESRICGHFAKIARCPLADSWSEQTEAFCRFGTSDTFPWVAVDVRLLPFEADVMSALMTSKMKKVDQDLLLALMADEGTVFMVQDERTVGSGSLWLMVMEGEDNSGDEAAHALGWPVRMIVNTLDGEDGRAWRVTAIQFQSIFNDRGT